MMLRRAMVVPRSRVWARALSTAPAKKYFILNYDYVPDIMEKRTPFREAHLKLANALKDDGNILAAGAFPQPPYGAAFIFHVEDTKVIESFVAEDPYVLNHLVTGHTIKEWAVVVNGLHK